MASLSRAYKRTRIHSGAGMYFYVVRGASYINKDEATRFPRNKITKGPNRPSRREAAPVRLSYVAYENTQPSKAANAPPVLILHDVMDSKSHWQNVAKELHTRTLRKVYALDLRNHGESEHADHMNYLHISQDVKRFMDDHRIERCCLFGQGMGGRAAMALALRFPSYVERLAVINACPTKVSGYHIAMLKYLKALTSALGRLSLREERSLIRARRYLEAELSRVVTDDIARCVLTQNLVRADTPHGRIAFKWRVNLLSIITHFPYIATFPVFKGRSYSRSAIFIQGAREERVTEVETMAIRRLFPNSQFHWVPRCGHFLQSQNSTDFMALINNFLRV